MKLALSQTFGREMGRGMRNVSHGGTEFHGEKRKAQVWLARRALLRLEPDGVSHGGTEFHGEKRKAQVRLGAWQG